MKGNGQDEGPLLTRYYLCSVSFSVEQCSDADMVLGSAPVTAQLLANDVVSF